MGKTVWRHLLPVYLVYIIIFPSLLFVVESRPLNGPTLCLFRQLTHLDCPACGLTRSFRAMGQLDAVGAIRYNPLGPVLFAIAVVAWGYAVAMVCSGGRITPPAWWETHQYQLVKWGLALFLLVGLVRIGFELRYPPPPPHPWTIHIFWPFPR